MLCDAESWPAGRIQAYVGCLVAASKAKLLQQSGRELCQSEGIEDVRAVRPRATEHAVEKCHQRRVPQRVIRRGERRREGKAKELGLEQPLASGGAQRQDGKARKAKQRLSALLACEDERSGAAAQEAVPELLRRELRRHSEVRGTISEHLVT